MPGNNARNVKVFQYPTRESKRPPKRRTPIIEPKKEPKEQMGLIQGKRPESWEEWRVYKALVRLKVRFIYQVPILGGKQVRGGQVLDFLCYTPFPIPMPIMGKYWHRASPTNEDKWKLAILRKLFGVEPAVLYDDQLQDDEAAYQAVKGALRL